MLISYKNSFLMVLGILLASSHNKKTEHTKRRKARLKSNKKHLEILGRLLSKHLIEKCSRVSNDLIEAGCHQVNHTTWKQ